MDRRQLTRLLLAVSTVVVIALVVTTANGAGTTPTGPEAEPGVDTPVPVRSDPSTPDPGSESAYLHEVRRLANALARFSVPAMDLMDHEALVDGRAGLDEASAGLARFEQRNGSSPSSRQRRLAGLAAVVHRRWLAVRPIAMSEQTAEEGVLLVQGLGREAGVRAADLRSILDTMSGRAQLAALDAQLARAWPDLIQEGADTPA